MKRTRGVKLVEGWRDALNVILLHRDHTSLASEPCWRATIICLGILKAMVEIVWTVRIGRGDEKNLSMSLP